MKRFVWILLVLALICQTAFAEMTYYGTMTVVNCQEWVSLRASPDTSAKRLKRVPLDSIVTDAEWSDDCGDFLYCCYDGVYGYILSKYLEPWEEEEPAGEERYTSDLGFSFFFDPSLMRVGEEGSEDGQSLIVEADTGDGPVYLEIITPESLGVSVETFFEQSAPEGAEVENGGGEYGADLQWFQTPYAYNSEVVRTYYAVRDGGRSLAAIGTWPEEDNEYWLDLYTELMCSVNFSTSYPLRVDWAEETENALIVDEDGEYITLMSDETLTDVELLALTLTFDGDALFETEVLFTRDAISPEDPAVLMIAFIGDFPEYGIRFKDESGKAWQFAITTDERDGSLMLQAF
ncbi:MAG: SH3 domain-containing protein [Clostridia bacterium]|nr:SH3 domain-containing protein [Clostridia bacterium]